MIPELVGVWSASSRHSPNAQADEILVFKTDGIGWLEITNFHLWAVDIFEWTLTSPGWVALAGIKHIEPQKYTRQIIETAATFDIEHQPYKIKEENTLSGARLKVLHIRLLDLSSDAYGLLDANPEARAMPEK